MGIVRALCCKHPLLSFQEKWGNIFVDRMKKKRHLQLLTWVCLVFHPVAKDFSKCVDIFLYKYKERLWYCEEEWWIIYLQIFESEVELSTHVEEHSLCLPVSSKPYKCDFCYKVSIFFVLLCCTNDSSIRYSVTWLLVLHWFDHVNGGRQERNMSNHCTHYSQ